MRTMQYSPTNGGWYDPRTGNIPADGIDVPYPDYIELLNAERSGKVIQPGKGGYPTAYDPAPPSPSILILAKILELESMVTDRRIREAVLGVDNGWLLALDAEISALRAQVPK